MSAKANELIIYLQQAKTIEDINKRVESVRDFLKSPTTDKPEKKKSTEKELELLRAHHSKVLIKKGLPEMLLDFLSDWQPKENKEAHFIPLRPLFILVVEIFDLMLQPYLSPKGGIGLYDKATKNPSLKEEELVTTYGKFAVPALLDVLTWLNLSTEIPFLSEFPSLGLFNDRAECSAVLSKLLTNLFVPKQTKIADLLTKSIVQSSNLLKNVGLFRTLESSEGYELLLRGLPDLKNSGEKTLEDYMYKYPLQYFGKISFHSSEQKITGLEYEKISWSECKTLYSKIYETRPAETECFLDFSCIEAFDLKAVSNAEVSSDPYFVIYDLLTFKQVFRSSKIKKDLAPKWERDAVPQNLKCPLFQKLILQFWDQNKVSSNIFLGEVIIDTCVLASLYCQTRQNVIAVTLDLSNQESEKDKKKKKEHKDLQRGRVTFSLSIEF